MGLPYYRRTLLASGLLAVLGVFVLAVGIQQWTMAASGIGHTDSLAARYDAALSPETDGRYVVYMGHAGDSWSIHVVDLEGDDWSLEEGQEHLFAGHVGSGMALSEGQLLGDGVVLDLASRSTREAPWPDDWSPKALADGMAWGLQGGRVSSMKLEGGPVETWALPEGRGCEPSIVAASATRAAFVCGEGLWLATRGAPEPRLVPVQPSRANFAELRPLVALDESWLLVAVKDPGLAVRAFDASTLEPVSRFAVEGDGQPNGLAVRQGRWLLSFVRMPAGPTTYEVDLQFLRGSVGRPDNEPLGGTRVSVFSLPYQGAAPVGDAILLSTLEDVVLAHPGVSEFPALPFLLLGPGLLLAGAAWLVVAPRRLARTASGGKTKCLNCGKRRDPALPFCPLCGWRTEDEKKAALPPVDPWDKER